MRHQYRVSDDAMASMKKLMLWMVLYIGLATVPTSYYAKGMAVFGLCAAGVLGLGLVLRGLYRFSRMRITVDEQGMRFSHFQRLGAPRDFDWSQLTQVQLISLPAHGRHPQAMVLKFVLDSHVFFHLEINSILNGKPCFVPVDTKQSPALLDSIGRFHPVSDTASAQSPAAPGNRLGVAGWVLIAQTVVLYFASLFALMGADAYYLDDARRPWFIIASTVMAGWLALYSQGVTRRNLTDAGKSGAWAVTLLFMAAVAMASWNVPRGLPVWLGTAEQVSFKLESGGEGRYWRSIDHDPVLELTAEPGRHGHPPGTVKTVTIRTGPFGVRTLSTLAYEGLTDSLKK